jgi:hypothetical protein
MRPRQQSSALDDLGNQLLLSVGHHVHAVDTLDHLDANAHSLFPLPPTGSLGHPFHDLVRNPHPRHPGAYVLGCFLRAQRTDANQDVCPLFWEKSPSLAAPSSGVLC